MKKTFIPASHRPYVRGSQTKKMDSISYIDIHNLLSDKKKQKELIFNIAKNRVTVRNADNKDMREIILDFFPNLRD